MSLSPIDAAPEPAQNIKARISHNAKYTRRGLVAVAAVCNPPENRLTRLVCEALTNTISDAQRDDAVRVLLLVGAGSGFSTGVDLDELDDGCLRALSVLCDTIERSCKPVVAVMHGGALGAGLEIAMTLFASGRPSATSLVRAITTPCPERTTPDLW